MTEAGTFVALIAALPALARVMWDLSWMFGLKADGRRPTGPEPRPNDRAVTLILCSHNDLPALQEVWSAWRGQQFPDGWAVEWLVVDDGSTDGTGAWLAEQGAADPMLTVVHHDKQAPGKKGALAAGIEAARHDRLVLTDADCRPEPGWAHAMATPLRAPIDPGGADVVLGTCLPEGGPALLRFDALRVALQYVGEAACGRPYMGVGRSLAYRRSTWMKAGGFARHAHLASGDDDLFVQACIAQGRAVLPARPPKGGQRIRTLAAPDWREGWRRKRRHLSTAGLYAPGTRARLILDALLDPLILACALAGVSSLLHKGGWIPIATLAMAIAVRAITLASFSREWGGERHAVTLGIFLGPMRWTLLASATLRNLFTSSPKWTQRAPTSRS